MKLSITFLFIAGIAFILTFEACKKNKAATGIDKELLNMAKETAGFTWYKNSSALLNKSSGSGHNEPFLRTRYNSTAAAVLDSSGKIISGSVFPDGSLVVKELFSNSTEIGRYAILFKKPSDANADATGWVWGYVNADGTVAEPASNKGSGCRGCHSQANNIDLNLMNIYFP
jgi:hypothetical protein